MIAYNKTWLANLQLHEALKRDKEQGRITPAEFAAITEKRPVEFYTPTLLVRIGLFILTFVIVFFADGLLSLMASSSNIIGNAAWFFFLGALSYIALELMVNGKFHYHSGVDDALLFISGCLFGTGFSIMLLGNESAIPYVSLCGMLFLLSLLFSLRFTDRLMSAVCGLSFFAFIFFAWREAAGLSLAPFVIMAASALIYWLVDNFKDRKEFIHYEGCLGMARLVGLLTPYAAGNYYIIQNLADDTNGVGKPIAFGAFFWAWTILLPFVYLGFGIKRKDALLMRTGLLLFAAAVATFRYYHHILPTDVALTVVGAVLLSIVYGVMRYLKTPKYGFTYAEADEANLIDNIKVESLIVAETFSHTPAAPADGGVKFGGGDFGGGGSSGGF